MAKKDTKSSDKNAGSKGGKAKGSDDKDAKGSAKGAQSINVRHILVSHSSNTSRFASIRAKLV